MGWNVRVMKIICKDKYGEFTNSCTGCAGKLQVAVVCEDCQATGLIKQKDGAAVVCTTCKGTGKVYRTVFQGRKKAKGVKRVFLPVKGVIHYGRDTVIRQKVIHFSKYGCSFFDWEKSRSPMSCPLPVKEIYCPYDCFGEDIDENCAEGTKGHTIPSDKCVFWEEKDSCWKKMQEVYG